MKFRVIYQQPAINAQSPVRVVEETTGRNVGWINRYLDDPSLYRAERASIVRDWVQFTDGHSGRRLGDEILFRAGLEPLAERSSARRLSERQCV